MTELILNHIVYEPQRLIHSSFISSITEILEFIQHYIFTMPWLLHDNNNETFVQNQKKKKHQTNKEKEERRKEVRMNPKREQTLVYK